MSSESNEGSRFNFPGTRVDDGGAEERGSPPRPRAIEPIEPNFLPPVTRANLYVAQNYFKLNHVYSIELLSPTLYQVPDQQYATSGVPRNRNHHDTIVIEATCLYTEPIYSNDRNYLGCIVYFSSFQVRPQDAPKLHEVPTEEGHISFRITTVYEDDDEDYAPFRGDGDNVYGEFMMYGRQVQSRRKIGRIKDISMDSTTFRQIFNRLPNPDSPFPNEILRNIANHYRAPFASGPGGSVARKKRRKLRTLKSKSKRKKTLLHHLAR